MIYIISEVYYVISENWALTWDFQLCGMCDQLSLRSVCVTDQSLC